jgi:hypothetical protein
MRAGYDRTPVRVCRRLPRWSAGLEVLVKMCAPGRIHPKTAPHGGLAIAAELPVYDGQF